MGNLNLTRNMLTQQKKLYTMKSRSANVSPSRDVSICLSDTHSEALIDITFNEKIRKPAQICVKMIGNTSERQRQREKESEAARALRVIHEAEEAKHNAFKEKVFSEHDTTSRASTNSSRRARRCSRQIDVTIRAN